VVTDGTHERAVRSWRVGISRRALTLSLLAAGALALLALLLLASGGGGRSNRVAAARAPAHPGAAAPPSAPAAASAPAATQAKGGGSQAAAGGDGAVVGRRANVDEVADPTESSSYPAPASARHQAASAPAKAGEEIVAAGAPSDAEVRRELEQMEAVEHAAAKAARQRLTPVTGGRSIGGKGTIPVPANVPEVVRRVIAGANAIADFPYVFGGGHGSFVDNAYDCSGSVSYALAAGGLLGVPETSGELESWGAPGPGRYITVYANAGHTYMYVDGALYDTAGRSGVFASRWQVSAVDNSGYVARHWPGL